MQKPKRWTEEWSKDRFEARQTLTCQTLILEFLHFKAECYEDEVVPATQKTVQEFWNYLEKKKEELKKRGQQFADVIKYDPERIDSEIKYDRSYNHKQRWKPKLWKS